MEVFLERRNLIFEVKQGLAMLVLGWVTALCCSKFVGKYAETVCQSIGPEIGCPGLVFLSFR
jgi:hypothetical protein